MKDFIPKRFYFEKYTLDQEPDQENENKLFIWDGYKTNDSYVFIVISKDIEQAKRKILENERVGLRKHNPGKEAWVKKVLSEIRYFLNSVEVEIRSLSEPFCFGCSLEY